MRRILLRSCQGSLTEFPLALWILVFLVAFPVINLTGLAIAATCIYLTACNTAEKACCNQTYKTALSAVKSEADLINKSGFASFAGLTPVAGFEQTGVDLFVQATGVAGGSQVYGPNVPLTSPVDTTAYIYEYMTTASYDVKPLISLANIPFVGAIPGMGKPALLSMSAHRVCEFPQGLSPADSSSSFAGGTCPLNLANLGLDTPGRLSDASGASWNHPTIYRDIQSAGEKVVAENVFYVYANNADWTNANLATQQGDHVWMDYSADGLWSVVGMPDYSNSTSSWYQTNPPTVTTDASGNIPGQTGSSINSNYSMNLTLGYLLPSGEIMPMTSLANPRICVGTMLAKVDNSLGFEVGKRLTMKLPPGKLYFRVNMNEFSLSAADKATLFSHNQGRMLVRVIVTRPA